MNEQSKGVPGEDAERAADAADALPAEPDGTETPVAPAAAETVQELRDRWLRAEAELQNFRRRAQRDRDESRRSAEDAGLLELISVVDDLERALQSAAEAGAPESWTQGVKLVVQRIGESLARAGVRPMEPVGQRFDPRLHEALLEIDAPEGATPGHVVQVILTGYTRGDRALRAARVVVARAPSGNPA